MDGAAGFGDVARSGVESFGLSHDESFGVDDLDLNLNKRVNLNVSQIETQSESHVSEELDVDRSQKPIVAKVRTHKPIVEEVRTQEPIMEYVIVEDYMTSGEDAELGNGQEDESSPSDGQLFYDDERIDIAYETEYDVQSSEDAGTDDDDENEYFLVDEENEIIEPDVDVHLFDGFDSDPGNDDETSNYRRRRVNPDIPVKAVQDQLQRDLEVQISMSKAFRAKAKAEREIIGNHVLQETKTTQDNEIASLKRGVKKLEKKNRSITHRLKRLYKVGLIARVESSDNEKILGEDASKQGRIDAIDEDEKITLVSVHDVNASAGEEMFVTEQEVAEEVVEVINTAKLIIDDAQDSAATTTTARINIVDDIASAQELEEMKSTKPKKKGIVIQELGESTTTISSQLSSQQSHEKAAFDEEERLVREKAEKEEEVNIALIETWDDIQAKIDVDHQLAKRMQAQEQEELSIEEKATLFQQLLEKRKKTFCS
ncbi:hypothetical protein Tco_0621803 [Tanacetum coccineum]